MKRMVTSLLFIGGAALVFALPAAATTYVDAVVRIEANDATVYDGTVYITDGGCDVEDSTGTEHHVDGANALCALHAASLMGEFEYEVTYWDGFGFFLSSIDSYAGDYSNYWLYYVNYESPSVGMNDFALQPGDEVILTYGVSNPPLRLQLNAQHRREGGTVIATVDYYEYDLVAGSGTYVPAGDSEVHIGNTTVTTDVNGEAIFKPNATGTYSVYAVREGYPKTDIKTLRIYTKVKKYHSLGRYKRKQLVENGVEYLKRNIDDNGKVSGSIALTEWSAMALKAGGKNDKRMFRAVKQYRPMAKKGTAELARHIMALEAIGKDARHYNGANFVKRLKKTMDGEQFGDAAYCNDDIFAVLAMIAADEPYDSKKLKQGAEATFACINDDGGVSFAVGSASDIDTTAAWLNMASRLKGEKDKHGLSLTQKITNATTFLRQQQNPDGGWGYGVDATSNASSTAWVLQGLRAKRKEAKSMTTNNLNGFHYLDSLARSGGAFKYDLLGADSNEVLNTAYAVMALSGNPFPVNKKRPLKK
ncbi:MAG: DUF4430 domain-containing protein [Candidatus Kerfeldbacteria bacterium]